MEVVRKEWLWHSKRMIIPDMGEEGQQEIEKAEAFVAGIGGLGPVSSYDLAVKV